MKVSIDTIGRLVTPRPLRERIGLADGGTVEIDLEGSGLRLRPVAGNQLREEGDVLVIARTGVSVGDTVVRELINAERLLAPNFPAGVFLRESVTAECGAEIARLRIAGGSV